MNLKSDKEHEFKECAQGAKQRKDQATCRQHINMLWDHVACVNPSRSVLYSHSKYHK